MTARKRASDEDFAGRQALNLGAPTPGSNQAARQSDMEALSTADRSRANHTGTQTAATISDFDTQVRTSRLDQMAAASAPITVADGVNPTHAASKGQLDAAIAGLQSGQTLKGSVRAAVTTNVTIASPGATLDGIAAANGDIFLLTNQTTGSERGPYVFNGAAVPMTRAANWDTSAEAVLGSYWIVREGSQADKFALLTNDTAITLGTTVPAFNFIGAIAAVVDRYEADLGNGSATSFTVAHNLGTRAVIVSVRRNASPWDEIDVYNRALDVNTIVVEPDVVFASNEFHVLIKK